jgi:lysophospholipase L1-like esterase
MSILKRYNTDTSQWEAIDSGAINDGSLRITPNQIGNLSELNTPVKTDLVSGINSHLADNMTQFDNINTSIEEINTEIDAIKEGVVGAAPNPSYESIYAFARANDLNVLYFGDSLMQGYALPNSNGVDGELQYLGVKSFANLFYLDLMKKTANLVPASLANVIGTVGIATQFSVSLPEYLFYYINDCVTIKPDGINCDKSIKIENYYGKDITIWGIKDNLPEAAKCDVFIDGVKIGEIDEKTTGEVNPRDYFTPYTFTVNEGYHTVELKNFVSTGGAGAGGWMFYYCGISNRKHVIYNESYGAMGTNWALQNITRVLNKNPDIVMFGFGANDCGLPVEDPQHAEPALFYSNYLEIIKQIQDAFPNCKLSIMNSVPDSNAGAASWATDYMPLVYKIARLKNCRVIDTWNTLNAIDTALWRIDNIHPNEYGHSVLKELYEKKWIPEAIPQLDLVLTDRGTGARYRIKVTSGVLGIEAISY